MECTCIRHTELPHTTKLFADFVYHFGSRALVSIPILLSILRVHDGSRRKSIFPMTAAPRWLPRFELQNGDSESTSPAGPAGHGRGRHRPAGRPLFRSRLHHLQSPHGGQTGAPADRSTGMPAVPVFWLATEDHDFAEVNQFWTFDPANQPIELTVEGYDRDCRPAGWRTSRSTISRPETRRSTDFPFGDEIRELVEHVI